ncbi:TolC family protein [Gemmata sp.]|uniref:TolC family protein n=1 Tax=Gemmata sp. TaxID=1914242 RepID=UPI003F6F78F8
MTRLLPRRWLGLAALAAGYQTVEPPRPAPVPAPAPQAAVVPSPAVVQASAVEAPEPPAPTPAADASPIDLGVALRLAGVENPAINLAREVVVEALADQLAARSLLLPSVNVGGNLRLHRGAFLSAAGFNREVNLQSLYLGGGAGAIGTSSPVAPGVRLFAHLGDAAYEPLAAKQRVAVRTSEAAAVQNNTLLRVAASYLALVGAEARIDVLRRGERDFAEIARLTRVHAKAGQGREADANRAESHVELVRREVARAEEDVAVASAQLCGLLNLDPATRLRTPGGAVQPFRLVPEDSDAEVLIATALRSRPEVFARSAEIAEAQVRGRQESVRPWLPTVSVGYSYGQFSGGSTFVGSDYKGLSGRNDFDVLAVWTVQNLGFGNRARVHTADARVGAAIEGYDLATNTIRREVAEALADARAAAEQIKTTGASLVAAEEGFKLEMDRIGQALGRPIEILDSTRQLLDTRQEVLRAVIAFDVAQFRLFVATGSTPGTVAPQP